eukprot:TRINITY_DN7086_c0_g1_i1.p1 TRINITY_DN7086_c0_g1~~TRINITY_DN7086_c0_g1_i1.p1  ORF type:complete len:222 (+),score=13.57 TRINITY_DN7086_c0_g1_i1:129-794(+)
MTAPPDDPHVRRVFEALRSYRTNDDESYRKIRRSVKDVFALDREDFPLGPTGDATYNDLLERMELFIADLTNPLYHSSASSASSKRDRTKTGAKDDAPHLVIPHRFREMEAFRTRHADALAHAERRRRARMNERARILRMRARQNPWNASAGGGNTGGAEPVNLHLPVAPPLNPQQDRLFELLRDGPASEPPPEPTEWLGWRSSDLDARADREFLSFFEGP